MFRIQLYVLICGVLVEAAGLSRFSCPLSEQRLVIGESARSSFLELRLDAPVLALEFFGHFDRNDDFVKASLKNDSPNVTLQIGTSGTDFVAFVAEAIAISPSISNDTRPIDAELKLIFKRMKRHTRLHPPPLEVPAELQHVVISFPLSLRMHLQAVDAALGNFIEAVWRSPATQGTQILDLPASLAGMGTGMIERGSVAAVIDGAQIDETCERGLFVVHSEPLFTSFLPVVAFGRKRDVGVFVDDAVFSWLILEKFPDVGMFTASELRTRFYMFGSLIACGIIFIVFAGVVVSLHKDGRLKNWLANRKKSYQRLGNDETESSRPLQTIAAQEKNDHHVQDAFQIQEDIEQQDAFHMQGAMQQDKLPVQDAAQMELANTDFEQAALDQQNRNREYRANSSRWRKQRGALVGLYVSYVSTCIGTPLLNLQSVSCYQGNLWEAHMPFFVVFLITKATEMYIYATCPLVIGQLPLLWEDHVLGFFDGFLFVFIASFSGFFDGYADGTSITIVYKCGCELWLWMAACFFFGVFLLQWVILGTLAFFLDSSGKCFYKVLHMDLLAKCTEFDPEDAHAKTLWAVINWARFFGEDLPQGGTQSYVIIYVRKTTVLVVSVFLSVCSSAYAVYTACNYAVQASDAYRAKVAFMRQVRLKDYNRLIEDLCQGPLMDDDQCVNEVQNSLAHDLQESAHKVRASFNQHTADDNFSDDLFESAKSLTTIADAAKKLRYLDEKRFYQISQQIIDDAEDILAKVQEANASNSKKKSEEEEARRNAAQEEAKKLEETNKKKEEDARKKAAAEEVEKKREEDARKKAAAEEVEKKREEDARKKAAAEEAEKKREEDSKKIHEGLQAQPAETKPKQAGIFSRLWRSGPAARGEKEKPRFIGRQDAAMYDKFQGFLSLRFGGKDKEAFKQLYEYAVNLKEEIEKRGHEVFLCPRGATDQFGPVIMKALNMMDYIIPLATLDPMYGEDNGGKYVTYQELLFAHERNIHMFPIKMYKQEEKHAFEALSATLRDAGDENGSALVAAAFNPSRRYMTADAGWTKECAKTLAEQIVKIIDDKFPNGKKEEGFVIFEPAPGSKLTPPGELRRRADATEEVRRGPHG